jgi:hypothetical protein
MHPMATIRLPLISLACLLLPLAGCSTFDLRKGIPWIPGEDGELERPMKIVAVWTDTIMSHGEETPVRGFGGRLMFYHREDGKPVKVQGTLVVYAFDETNRDPRNVRPERKYVFSAEEFEKHYSESKLGHSYSVWLPWDKVGGPQAEVSLLVRFTPKAGGMITGEQQTVSLPGAAVQNLATTHHAGHGFTGQSPAGRPPIQQTSYVTGLTPPHYPPLQPNGVQGQIVPSAQNERTMMTTTTIPIPPRAGNRLPSTAPGAFSLAMVGQINSPPNQQAVQQTSQAGQQMPQAGRSLARFGPDRLRPLGEPIAPLSRDRGPWQLTHATRPSAAEASRQSAPAP